MGEASALGVLNDAVSQVLQVGEEFRTPNLEVSTGTPPDLVCGIARAASLGDREALNIAISMDMQSRCPVRVSLYRTKGEIDAVVTWTERPLPANTNAAPVPDVVGKNLAKARDTVTAAGFSSRVERTETCGPHPGVVEQAPTQQALEEDDVDDPDWSHVVTLVVEIPSTNRDCAALDAAAADFIAFAQGGPPPAWAPEVQQLFGYDLRDTITAEQADDRAAWSYCSGVSPSECDLSTLVVAGSGEVKTAEYSERYECEMVDNGGLPSGLSPEDHIVLFPAVPPDCADDWSVKLWIDDSGRISAVNLLVSEVSVNEE